jgi:predicted  nucleic acid-binding Zn-ribbon protein
MLSPNQIKRQEDLKNTIQEMTKTENSLMYQLEVIRDEISDLVQELTQLKEEDRLSNPVNEPTDEDIDNRVDTLREQKLLEEE